MHTHILSLCCMSLPLLWILQLFGVSQQNFSPLIRKIWFYYVPVAVTYHLRQLHRLWHKTNFRRISQQMQRMISSSPFPWEWKNFSHISNQLVTLENCRNTCTHTRTAIRNNTRLQSSESLSHFSFQRHWSAANPLWPILTEQMWLEVATDQSSQDRIQQGVGCRRHTMTLLSVTKSLTAALAAESPGGV